MEHKSVNLSLLLPPCLVLLDFNQVFVNKFENFGTSIANTHKKSHKNHVLAPIEGKDLKHKLFLEVVLRVLEGLINFHFFICSVYYTRGFKISLDCPEGRIAIHLKSSMLQQLRFKGLPIQYKKGAQNLKPGEMFGQYPV